MSIKSQISIFSDRLKKNLADHEAWYWWGAIIDSMADDASEASAYYRKAIQFSPFNHRYHIALITLLIDSQQIEAAMEAFNVASDLVEDTEGKISSEYKDLCAEVATHLLYHLELEEARSILLKIPPREMRAGTTLFKVGSAYLDLFLFNLEAESDLMRPGKLKGLEDLPKTRLNPARYFK